MTDKQIIIDGVDVSGCEHYDEVCLGNHHYKWCKDNDNCYYKQLKRKEQECEELKKENLQEVGQLKFAIGTLTAENLHLKELLDMRIEALCDSCKAGSMLPIKCRIYEKTLTEIKEIAEKIDDSDGCAYGDYDCNNCSSLEQETVCTYKVKKLILQKISECEGNDGL